MRLIRLCLMSITLVAILSGVMPLPSYAYPVTARVKVIVPMKPADRHDIRQYDCVTATLVAEKDVIITGTNDEPYSAKINNPGNSNKCTLTFEDVLIRADGYFYLDYTYAIDKTRDTISTFIYIATPNARVYTTLPVYMPAQ